MYMKKTIAIIMSVILGVIIIIAILGIIKFNFIKDDVVIVPEETPKKEEPIQLCFYQESKTNRGLYDVSWLKMSLTDKKVTGEFSYLPAEKDSKTGIFEGVVSDVDKMNMSRTATVWWSVLSEGIKNREELQVVFGEGNAMAGFGEMTKENDGVYVYKDKSSITYGPNMVDVSCEELNNRISVEKYVRENIQTLSPEKPVLGGVWYVTSIHLDPKTQSGIVKYEDGHIQGSALFDYVIQNELIEIRNIEKGDETSLRTKYISSANKWPPKVSLVKGIFICKEGGDEIQKNGLTEIKIINEKEYCKTSSSEGAAGSVYTTYTYNTKIEKQIAKLTFTLKKTQCENYDDPAKEECLTERENFNPDILADNLVLKMLNK